MSLLPTPGMYLSCHTAFLPSSASDFRHRWNNVRSKPTTRKFENCRWCLFRITTSPHLPDTGDPYLTHEFSYFCFFYLCLWYAGDRGKSEWLCESFAAGRVNPWQGKRCYSTFHPQDRPLNSTVTLQWHKHAPTLLSSQDSCYSFKLNILPDKAQTHTTSHHNLLKHRTLGLTQWITLYLIVSTPDKSSVLMYMSSSGEGW